MSIVEFNGGPITHRYLMNKTKSELASMYMDLLRVHERLDASETRLIEDRDHWHDKATELANDVGNLLGFDVGEHSNANCPVQTAIDGLFEMADTVKNALTPNTAVSRLPENDK